jgi:hypothetical protein
VTFFAGVLLASGVVMATAASKTTSVKACIDQQGALRLLGKKACPKGAKALTLQVAGATGATGLAGAQGPAGASDVAGPKGDAGAPGAKGDTGPAGTPDPSGFYTKDAADARFAHKGHTLKIPGVAFTPLDSGTGIAYAEFVGIYETGPRQYAAASLAALPDGATITSVDFTLLHKTGGQTELDIGAGTAFPGQAAGNLDAVSQRQYTTLSPNIVSVTLTPGNGFTPSAGQTPLLYWNPANQSTNDIIYAATVHYTQP